MKGCCSLKYSFQLIFIIRTLKKTVIRTLIHNDVNFKFQVFHGKVPTREITDQAVHVLAKSLQIVSNTCIVIQLYMTLPV